MEGDDRPLADLVIASVAERQEEPRPVDPLLAIGQILVSIALIIAILLQARGVGLSGTFGGDSAVYRSRRGVERRLWQFTIVLLVLFIVFSLAAFLFAPATTAA
jgi:preprotein translocase subunit SecG